MFDYGIVFSNTAWEAGNWDFIPKNYVYEEFNEQILKNLMELQKKNLANEVDTSAFVIFDDCIDDADTWTCNAIKKLTTQLRHYNITVIITTQYCHILPPRIRSNAMYSMFLNIGQGRRELESIFNCYGQRFTNFEEFKKFYYENIKDHKFVMYNKEKDKYITYRCPSKIPEFKFKYNKTK